MLIAEGLRLHLSSVAFITYGFFAVEFSWDFLFYICSRLLVGWYFLGFLFSSSVDEFFLLLYD